MVSTSRRHFFRGLLAREDEQEKDAEVSEASEVSSCQVPKDLVEAALPVSTLIECLLTMGYQRVASPSRKRSAISFQTAGCSRWA